MILYTTGCPNCRLLDRTLNKLGIKFEINNSFDSEELAKKTGIFSAPILFYEDNYYNFYQSMELIKKLADEGKI